MTYNIISTGSKGNAVVINDNILIDVGVSYKSLQKVVGDLKVVLLTHIHSDHFRFNTIKKLAFEKPLLKFVCCEWLVKPLLMAGVNINNIAVVSCGKAYKVGNIAVISPIKLYHDVPNAGYRIYIGKEKLLYATDTAHLNGISAKDYDLYLIEANYEDSEIKKRIEKKLSDGEYAYEIKAMNRHLSKQQADEFIFNNAGLKSKVEYIHLHEGLEF